MDNPVQTEDIAVTSNLEVSQPVSPNLEVNFQIPVSVPITDDFIEDASIPFLTATISTLITIVPCPPPVSSQV